MIQIDVKGSNPGVFAELVGSTLYGHASPEPDSALGFTGKLVRERQEEAERKRPARDCMDTVDFKLIDDDNDWSEL
jgi:hypothetical protein